MSKQEQAPVEAQQPSQIEAITQLAKAILENGQPSQLDMSGMSKERQAQLMGKRETPRKYRKIEGCSEDTGATFMMIVVESRRHEHGIVTKFENYRYPDGVYTPMSQGGRVPDGAPIWRDGKALPLVKGEMVHKTHLHVNHAQWLWTEFWQADLKRIASGRPLRASNCVRSEDVKKVPWLEGATFAVEDAAE